MIHSTTATNNATRYIDNVNQWREHMRIVANASDIQLDVIMLNLQTAAVYSPESSSVFVLSELAKIMVSIKIGRTVDSQVGYSQRVLNGLRTPAQQASGNRPSSGGLRKVSL